MAPGLSYTTQRRMMPTALPERPAQGMAKTGKAGAVVMVVAGVLLVLLGALTVLGGAAVVGAIMVGVGAALLVHAMRARRKATAEQRQP